MSLLSFVRTSAASLPAVHRLMRAILALVAMAFAGLLPLHPASAATGLDWTAASAAAANNWISVTYGNGLFVAVSNDGTNNRVMTSPDGITWTSRTSAADNFWQSVTYGNGLFVAVSLFGTGNRVMTSPDGITWTGRTAAEDNIWPSVAYGKGRFVAVAGSGTNRVMYSGTDCGDGLAYTVNQWRQVALPCVPSASPADVAGVLGNSPTANLASANLGTTWSVYGRNATNSGNTSLFTSSTLANGAGYWLKSSEAPVSGTLNVAGAAATVTTGSPRLGVGQCIPDQSLVEPGDLAGAGSWRYAAVPGGDDGACNLQLALLGSRISDERDNVSSLSSRHKRIQDVLAHVAIKRLTAG